MIDFFGKKITQEQMDEMLEDVKKFIQNDTNYEKHQNERFEKFIEKLSDEQIDFWMDKFLKWEKEYEDFRYLNRREQSDSHIFSNLICYLKPKGASIKINRDEMFCTYGFKWKNYKFKLYQGQGAFWKIWKKRKLIFTNI